MQKGSASTYISNYLIDDTERNLQALKGTPIVFNCPAYCAPEGLYPGKNWQEVADYFLEEC